MRVHVDSPAGPRGAGDGTPRLFTEADCLDVARRLTGFAKGGGTTSAIIYSWWRGSVRWARNQVSLSGDVRNNFIMVTRTINGATGQVMANDPSDAGLVAAVRRAERLLQGRQEWEAAGDFAARVNLEPMEKGDFFSDATFGLDEETRARAARELARSAGEAGLLSAGYLEAGAYSLGQADSLGRLRYAPYTYARYTVTVRDPQGVGSGWAGQDHWDWAKIDAPTLSTIAVEKCVKSIHPVRVEPGRYTAILESQAVADFVAPLLSGHGEAADRGSTEDPGGGPRLPFFKRRGFARFGERVIDPRLTIRSDPTDPALGYPPMELIGAGNEFFGDVFHPVTWIKDGVLTELAYQRGYALRTIGANTGRPNEGGFRIDVSGPTSTVDEMVAATKRGLLVTRLHDVRGLDSRSMLLRGYTRDGLWLVEDGKISKAVKNFVFTESLLGALNSVEQLGVPQRAFRPREEMLWALPEPAVVPAMKLTDFSFTALTDAV